MTSLGVLASFVIVWMADPSPSPGPGGFTGDETAVTPGVIGFVATFFVAALTVLLIVDMTRRIRRVRYRAEARERLAAEGGAEQGATPAPED